MDARDISWNQNTSETVSTFKNISLVQISNMNALELNIIHQWVICILLIDSVASFNFNPHTKTEIPGIEKIKIVIKVNSLCLSTVGHLHSFFFRSEGALFLPGFSIVYV